MLGLFSTRRSADGSIPNLLFMGAQKTLRVLVRGCWRLVAAQTRRVWVTRWCVRWPATRTSSLGTPQDLVSIVSRCRGANVAILSSQEERRKQHARSAMPFGAATATCRHDLRQPGAYRVCYGTRRLHLRRHGAWLV